MAYDMLTANCVMRSGDVTGDAIEDPGRPGVDRSAGRRVSRRTDASKDPQGHGTWHSGLATDEAARRPRTVAKTASRRPVSPSA